MQHILVIEDSPMVLKILSYLFRREQGLEPVFCASLAEAEVMLETSAGQFFAAIVDLNLPDGPNGESVDLVMRYHLPCIVLSGSCNEQRRDELLLKGVVDYVLKESQYSYEYAFRLLHRLERNRRIKILIAEDSEATRRYIRHVLSPQGFQLIDASDGNEALRILQEQPDIDLLVVDHSMPGISGFELVKLLRQKLQRKDLIIVGLSADAKGSLSATFIKHGADDFLRKPFCPEELTCRVMSCLERRDMLEALRHAAEYDALTGLRNRRSFCDKAGAALSPGQQPTLAMLDLDFFKTINDHYGHAGGDAALVAFARALKAAFPDALTGRFGGEEFVIFSQQDSTQVRQTLEKLRQACQSLRNIQQNVPPLSFSAGVYQGPETHLEQLLQKADQRLYQAKHQGRGCTF